MTITGLVFMVVFLGALVVALVRYPIVGLFAYIGEFYLHPPSRWWGAFLPDLRWSMLAAGVTVVALLWRLPLAAETGRERWFKTTPAKIMIVFTAWFWLGKLWALAPDVHVAAGVLITKYIVVYWIIYRLVDTPQKVTAFLLAHLIGCFYLGYLGLTTDAPGGRLDGVGGPGIDDSNTLGMHLATGAVVGAMILLTLRGWRMFVCIVAIALAMNGLVMTGSRGAFLALIAGGATLMYFKPAEHKRLFIVYAALGIVLFAYVASEQFWSRMDTVTAAVEDSETMDTSAESRVEMFKAQVKMAARYPWGAGHRGSEVMSAQYLDPKYLTAEGARSSHNAFMTVLVEQGIPGAIMFFMMAVWVRRSMLMLKRRSLEAGNPWITVHAGAIGAALVVVLIGGLFADFSKCEVQIWMFALLAAISQKQMYAETAATEKVAPVPGPPLPSSPLRRVTARRRP